MATVTDIEGRLRVRDERLKNPSAAESVREAIAACPGVVESRASSRAGSLLVLYRHSIGVRDEIMACLGRHLPAGKMETETLPPAAPARPAQPPRPACCAWSAPVVSARRLTRAGMMISLAVSLLGAAFDRKKLHVASGIVFLASLAFHLKSKRRLLFS